VRPQILSDGTVWLSVPGEQDIDVIARTCRHSSIGEWTTVPVPYHRSDAAVFVRTIVPGGWAERSPTWAVRMVDGGPVIGMISLQRRRADNDAAEIGYWLAPGVRGRGLMTRAVLMVCEFAFAPGGMRLDRVEWRAFVGNHGSAAVARRAGFRYEGMLRGGGLQRGRRRDEWIAGRLRGDSARAPLPAWPVEVFGSG
jgi:RimJ/RimL family protein N-acetyltransferase